MCEFIVIDPKRIEKEKWRKNYGVEVIQLANQGRLWFFYSNEICLALCLYIDSMFVITLGHYLWLLIALHLHWYNDSYSVVVEMN